MNKWLLIVIALSLSPLVHAMKHDPIDATEQAPKRLKIESEYEEEQAARAWIADNRFVPTALHIACEWKNVQTVRKFVKAKMNINVLDDHGRTPLHYIHINYHAYDNYPRRGAEIARLLLAYDAAGINIQDHLGNTPLHLAAREGALGIIPILLQFGADPNVQNNDGKSALHQAIQHKGSYKRRNTMVKKLLEYSANVDAQDGKGATPLHYVSFYGYYDDIMPLLIKAGAHYILDVEGKGPFQYVFKEELEEALRDEEYWQEIVNNSYEIKEFDLTFATLLWAFPAFAKTFTTQDRHAVDALLTEHQGLLGPVPSSPVSSSDEEISAVEDNYDPYLDSLVALRRAVNMMDNPALQKEIVEKAGNELRKALVHSVCKKGSIITVLNTRAVTGKLKPQ